MRTLIVEDEPKMADVLRRGLTRAGLAVDLDELGEEALIRAGATEYHAIVVDAMLPGLDGLDVCRRLRADHVWFPVLMLTARSGVPDRVDGLDAGADDYLAKPLAFDELLARLRALARRGPVERAPVLEVGDLRLDPAGHRAWRGETQLDLSAKELSMLEIFMRNPGQVLRRFTLLEGVWEGEYENRSNFVDVYVRLLREKVDRPFGRASLETVRGSATDCATTPEPPVAEDPAHARVRRRRRGAARRDRHLHLPARRVGSGWRTRPLAAPARQRACRAGPRPSTAAPPASSMRPRQAPFTAGRLSVVAGRSETALILAPGGAWIGTVAST